MTDRKDSKGAQEMGEKKIVGTTELVSLRELCEMSGLAIRTIQTEVYSGKLMALRLARTLYFRPEDIDKWILGRRITKYQKRR